MFLASTVNDTWLTPIGQFEVKANKSTQHNFDQSSVIINLKSEDKIMHKNITTKQRSKSM